MQGGITALIAAAVVLAAPAPPAGTGQLGRTAATRRYAHAAIALPADLRALVQRMEGLTVSSERFRLRTAVSASGSASQREVARFLSIFDVDLSGEATISPPAGSFKLTFLGHTFTAREVAGVTYIYEPAIARHDRGRPWIELGRGGLGSLFGTPEGPASVNSESGSFRKLAGLLGRAVRVQELGPGTVDSQAISGFRLTLDRSALEEGSSAPAKPKSITEGIGLRAAAPPAPAITLEIMIAPSGLPVQTRISVGEEGVTVGLLDDLYAVDFPLVVKAPPKRQTISLAALRRLTRAHARKHRAG